MVARIIESWSQRCNNTKERGEMDKEIRSLRAQMLIGFVSVFMLLFVGFGPCGIPHEDRMEILKQLDEIKYLLVEVP